MFGSRTANNWFYFVFFPSSLPEKNLKTLWYVDPELKFIDCANERRMKPN